MTRYQSVDLYISNQPAKTALVLQQLREIIMQAVPASEQIINYNIPAFALVQGGKRDQQIMIAGHNNHVGFYPSPEIITHFKKDLGIYKHSKGSIQFPLDKPLPKRLIIKMIQYKRSLL